MSAVVFHQLHGTVMTGVAATELYQPRCLEQRHVYKGIRHTIPLTAAFYVSGVDLGQPFITSGLERHHYSRKSQIARQGLHRTKWIHDMYRKKATLTKGPDSLKSASNLTFMITLSSSCDLKHYNCVAFTV